VPLVDVDTAARELRITLETGEDADLERKLNSAQEQAQSFLGRNVYATQEELTAAIDAAPATLSAASAAYDAARDAACAMENHHEARLNARLAKDTYNEAIEAWQRTVRGMVANDSVRTAILLITGSLWEHRGDEDAIEGIPKAALAILWPFRIGLGV
jgi:hypothetical protein